MILYLSITVKNLFPFSIRDPTLSMLERGGEEGGWLEDFFQGHIMVWKHIDEP